MDIIMIHLPGKIRFEVLNMIGIDLFSTTAINGDTLNGDFDSSSTSSQTSSEHDSSVRPQIQTYNVSPSTNWPDEKTSFFATTNNNNLASSSQQSQVTNKSSMATLGNSTKDIRPNETASMNNTTVKSFDQIPEYKLFSSNAPSIHTMLFGNNDNSQSIQQSHRPIINGIDHDVREIEKRLLGNRQEIIYFTFLNDFYIRKWTG
jgi:hypothetical protein